MKLTLSPANNIQTINIINNRRKAKANAAILGVMSIVTASCSTIRGGNFIFDEAKDKIEPFQDYKTLRNIKGKDVFYDADSLKTEPLSKGDIDKRILPTKNNHCLEFFQKDGEEIKPNIFGKSFLDSIDLDKWIEDNHERLIGSCVFTQKEKNQITKFIVKHTTGTSFKNEFVPSHVGTIFEQDGKIKILNILAPKAEVHDLKDFLRNYKGKYILYLRDYDLNTDRFSKSVASYKGISYGYLSAFQSLLKGFDFKKGYHCSEVQLIEMQKEGLFKGINANKITPNTLMHLLINNRFK